MQWQPIAKVEVHPCDPPRVRWNVASLAGVGLERVQLAPAADRIFSRVQIQWGGQRYIRIIVGDNCSVELSCSLPPPT
eukprot:9367621-Pyramimonas_sp.AAC.1